MKISNLPKSTAANPTDELPFVQDGTTKKISKNHFLQDKVDKVDGKELSTNDYTDEEKNKLAGIETGAQVNPDIDTAMSATSTNAVQNKVIKAYVDDNLSDIPQSDWNENNSEEKSFVKNRPFYTKPEETYPVLVPNPIIENISIGDKIGIKVGNTYHFSLVDNDRGVTTELSGECTIEEIAEGVFVPLIFVEEIVGAGYLFEIIDGISDDISGVGNYCAYILMYQDEQGEQVDVKSYTLTFKDSVISETDIPLPDKYSPVKTRYVTYPIGDNCKILSERNGKKNRYSVMVKVLDSNDKSIFSNGPKVDIVNQSIYLSRGQDISFDTMLYSLYSYSVKLPVRTAMLLFYQIEDLDRVYVEHEGLINLSGENAGSWYSYYVETIYDTNDEAEAAFKEVSTDGVKTVTLKITETPYVEEGAKLNV